MPKMKTSIALDTEDTGLDLYHGAEPFFVTTCTEEGEQRWWEWDVDPLTRKVTVPPGDIKEITELLNDHDEIVTQNGKFDATALLNAGIVKIEWGKIRDTLTAGHLLASNHPHNLTHMVMYYLPGEDIQPLEMALKEAVQESRRKARSYFPDWKIAAEGLEGMPSAKSSSAKDAETGEPVSSPWGCDYWLPREMARVLQLAKDHYWWNVLSEYSNGDSSHTMALWLRQREEIKRRGLMPIYLHMVKMPGIAWRMERNGVTVNGVELEKMVEEFSESSKKLAATCVSIAARKGYDLVMPKGGINKSLSTFCFSKEGLNLPVVKRGEKSGAPSLDGKCIDHYSDTTTGESLEFVKSLGGKRKADTAVTYMTGYKRYWLPLKGRLDWWILHPSCNPHGTHTLRWSFSNPNEANVSKKSGFNLRRCFGPAPGREWWSLDAQNLELRIPAFEAGEELLIEVFSNPKRPPYYGSYHLVVADLLYPELFKKHGKAFKVAFEDTLYQWIKNGNFAIIYGAQQETADRTYHFPGAFDTIRVRFPKIALLADKQLEHARKQGWVETIPDRDICPEHGYPLICSRDIYGKVLPTVPLNYHVSGTAMQFMNKAMVRVQDQLDEWERESGFDGFITMQVHDELVLDFPKGRGEEPWRTNLPKLRKVQRLIEMGGDDIGVPIPCSVDYHATSWDVSRSMN